METPKIKPPDDSQTTQLPEAWHKKIIGWIVAGLCSTVIAGKVETELHGKTNHAQIGRFKNQYLYAQAVLANRPRCDAERVKLDKLGLERDDLRLQMAEVTAGMLAPDLTEFRLDALKAADLSLSRRERAQRAEINLLTRSVERHEASIEKLSPAFVPAPEPPHIKEEPIKLELTPVPLTEEEEESTCELRLFTDAEKCVLLYLNYRGIRGSGIPMMPMPPELVALGDSFDKEKQAEERVRRGLTPYLSREDQLPPPAPPAGIEPNGGKGKDSKRRRSRGRRR